MRKAILQERLSARFAMRMELHRGVSASELRRLARMLEPASFFAVSRTDRWALPSSRRSSDQTRSSFSGGNGAAVVVRCQYTRGVAMNRFRKIWVSLTAALALPAASMAVAQTQSDVTAACDRACLTRVVDVYVAGLLANDPA